jgi:hypothetical protein
VPSETDVDAEFWQRADAHIHLANAQCDKIGAGKVSASLLYAAARFNAFIVASQAEDDKALRAQRQRAVEYFVGQYRKMFEENIDDYISNYKKYIESKHDGHA